MRKLFTFLFAALMSVGMYATTVTWNSSTLSSILLYDGSFTQDGVTVTVLSGTIDGQYGEWMGYTDDSFKFSTSLGNFTRIEITGTIYSLHGSGWTQASPGAVWTGEANETTFGDYFNDVTQIVFTIEEPAPTTYTLKLVADPTMGSVAVTNLLGSDIVDNGNGNYTVPENAKVTILATPNEGYEFSGWLEGNVLCDFIDCGTALNTLDNPLTFTMTNDAACKAEFAAVAPAAKYYIVGTMNSWQVDENYEMNPSLDAETEEYFYTLDLTTTSEFKVVKVQNGQQSWIPEGMGNNYGQNGEITEDGEYTVYFRPNYDGGEDWFYSCIYAEKTGEFVPETPTYYLVGNMTEWDVNENYELNPNIDSDIEEYFYVLDLTTSSQFKVVKVQNGQQSWFPSGMGNNYGENGEITADGEYTIYFRPNYNGGEDWFYNCIYVSKNEPEPAEVTVVFAANNKTVERTVTLPHTFKCDFIYENGELDGIIQELYSLEYGGMCHASYVPEATGNAAVTAGKTGDDNRDHYIQIAEAFEGTATVTGYYRKYNVDYDTEEMTYTLTISIKAGSATAVENVQTNQVQGTKILRDGMLLIVRDDKTYTITGQQVK